MQKGQNIRDRNVFHGWGGGGLQFSSGSQTSGVGGGSGRGGGGGAVEKDSPIWGHFLIPHFILNIIIIQTWDEILFYPSQQMRNSTKIQQM